MCGIFGWNFTTAPKRRNLDILATALALANDSRGGDSWGYYAPLANVHKRGVGAMSTHVRPSRLSAHPVLIGHTRKATTGEVTEDNAHPFAFPSLIGAHNGIVDNHHELSAAYPRRKCAVDSQHIFAHLDRGLPLEEIETWGAIEYVKLAQPSRVYLARFNGGELSVARVKDGVVWSSSSTALTRALFLARLQSLSSYDVKDNVLHWTENGQLWTANELLGFAPITPYTSCTPFARTDRSYRDVCEIEDKRDGRSRWAEMEYDEEKGQWINAEETDDEEYERLLTDATDRDRDTLERMGFHVS